ncbi:A24 family peptidase [Halalkalibacter alkaliphilus]|uniref:A24 family peptidase n=1 Tax=Halalkalibacter alkaliphilus TaxID=2917993 RepID=A0A9X2A4E5_9BACI|nr:A24 family peptidase [Halalkalibacter alkaliphilus]MCL7746732.1 A24 family peptidase [Halalkalibacter alkaliphilus]
MTLIILFLAMAISLFTDIKNRKILNIVTLPAMLLGLILNTINYGWEGLLLSFLGLLIGFGLLVIPYALGGMAAGDVKLLMAIGALQGPAFVFGSFLYTAIFGGIMALIILVMKKELLSSLKRIFVTLQLKTLDGLNKNDMHHAFPYGVAIVLGTVCYSGVNLL